ncbi:hypothetical protein, partial [Thalassospira lucentensis]|uniref:hypothetical protein n=1 Tax=Thalassospira lucentensis TaxID=168935 RepID=UPI00142E6E63
MKKNIELNSWQTKLCCAMIVFGISLPFAHTVYAKSPGCSIGDLNTTTNRFSFSTGPLTFAKGERISITITGPGGGVRIDEIRYRDNNNGANDLGGADGTNLAAGQTKTTNFTIPADTTDGRITITLNSTTSVTTSCLDPAPAPSPESSSNDNNSTTKTAVVSAVARSQTNVLQQNIAARVASTNGNSSIGRPGTPDTEPQPENTNLVD